jgi:hypothetical protein
MHVARKCFRLLETLNKVSCLFLISIKLKSVAEKTTGIYQINVVCYVLFFFKTRCYICIKQDNVYVCRCNIQDINDSSFLVQKHTFTSLSFSNTGCVCVRACSCGKVYVCEICGRLGYNEALSGNYALTFRDNPSVPSSKL